METFIACLVVAVAAYAVLRSLHRTLSRGECGESGGGGGCGCGGAGAAGKAPAAVECAGCEGGGRSCVAKPGA